MVDALAPDAFALGKETGAEALAADLATRLGNVIKRAEQALSIELSQALREVDLTVPQYSALMVLHYLPNVSGAQLARTIAVTPQTMATVLANLEAKGLIERTPSEVHSRVLVTRLSRPGRAVVKRANQRARAIENRLWGAYSAEERAQLVALLERAVDVVSGGESTLD
jgi:DNA-binding MarR family transcriptional regulator